MVGENPVFESNVVGDGPTVRQQFSHVYGLHRLEQLVPKEENDR